MWRTVGQERALNILQRGLREGRLSHAYLIVGPPNVGKMTLALDLARAVNCLADDSPCGECNQCRRIAAGLHPDVEIVGLEDQAAGDGRGRVAIGIDQVREVQRGAALKPYEGRYRVFIFDGAQHLSEEAANALLKLLEEPPDQVVLVLLAQDVDGLLSTLLSRCSKLQLRPLPLALVEQELQASYEVEHERAQEIARLSGGRLGWAVNAVTDPELLARRDKRLTEVEATVRAGLEQRFTYAATLAASFLESREPARDELGLWLEWWRDVMMVKCGVPELVTNQARLDTLTAVAEQLLPYQAASAARGIQTAAYYLDRNVNPRLALEGLMLGLPRP